ncbi:hypothetical protein niasHS_009194 [Heterodera schachtii]|uniref:Uncharacterized protein n=1 Tax=Heterodera schachtii TaxID=97005 RepID=A0ABD2IXT7_HETSC
MKRRRSLVVIGLPENAKTTPGERVEEDEAKVKEDRSWYNEIRTARLLIRPNLTKEQLDAERQQRMANRRPFPSK